MSTDEKKYEALCRLLDSALEKYIKAYDACTYDKSFQITIEPYVDPFSHKLEIVQYDIVLRTDGEETIRTRCAGLPEFYLKKD